MQISLWRPFVRQFTHRRIAASVFWLLVVGGSVPFAAAGVLDEDGHLVRFDRDIAPIFRQRCLECHGPDKAKNDFRVDDVESLMSYIEPGDVEASSLYTDYLTSDDEDIRMPPTSHHGPLGPAELALIRTWIQENAIWPDGFELVTAAGPTAAGPTGAGSPGTGSPGTGSPGTGSPGTGSTGAARTGTGPLGATDQVVDVPPPSAGLLARIWAFQGYLHPAAVHFPIALLSIGGLFVVLGWVWPSLGTQVPLACLWIGATAAIGTTLMGWSFATEQGYGAWDRVDMDSEVFWHRWSGVVVTIIAVISAIIAAIAVYRDSSRLTKFWKAGLLAAALLVGLVGHQGGEMTYGKTFYDRAFDRLWPPIVEAVKEAEKAVEKAVEKKLVPLTDPITDDASAAAPTSPVDDVKDASSTR